MKHEVRQAGKLPVRSLVLSPPALEAGQQLPTTFLDLRPFEPGLQFLSPKLQEDAFPLVLNRRQPSYLTGQGGAANSHFKFAFDVWAGRFEAGESDLGDDLAQPMHQDNSLNAFHPRLIPLVLREGSGKEVSVGFIVPQGF